MKIFNAQPLMAQSTLKPSFKGKYTNARYSDNNLNDTFTPSRRRTAKNRRAKNNRLIAIATALMMAGVGAGGYKIGSDRSDKETYQAGYQDGIEYALASMQEAQEIVEVEEEMATPTPYIAPAATPVVEMSIPSRVSEIAGGNVTEFNLTEKPYLFKDSSNLPSYFPEYGIDREVLKKAQYNFARVFKSGQYIIICPKQDTTMGEIKRVMGIADEVIGKEEVNGLTTRKQTEGSNGNFDNAIVEAGDAIKIKYYDETRGHVVGSYAIHNSDWMRKRIAETILEWANK